MHFTRIPCPPQVTVQPGALSQASALLPAIGWLIGVIAGVVFLIASNWLTIENAALLAIASAVLLTGALHEDGFADACDGFGGGWDREQILRIMKDSQLGSYGVIGLCLLLLCKWSLLTECLISIQAPQHVLLTILLFINGHTASRFLATSCVYFGQYARDKRDKKSKAAALHEKMQRPYFLMAIVLTAVPFLALLLATGNGYLLVCPPALALLCWQALRYFNRRLDGYTGDCLGAIQQAGELGFYLILGMAL